MLRAMVTTSRSSTSEKEGTRRAMPPSDCEVLTFPVSLAASLRLINRSAQMQYLSMVEVSAAVWSTAFATSMFHASTLILAASQITSDFLQAQRDTVTQISALRCGEQCENQSVMASPYPILPNSGNNL